MMSESMFQQLEICQRQRDAALAREQALQLRLNAADQRIDDAEDLLRRFLAVVDGTGWNDLERDLAIFLKPAEGERDHQIPGTSGTALGTGCGKCARCIAPLGEVKFKGMIETGRGNFAIMIDKANAHYGWTFKRHPDGMWVSGRVATPAEMHAAIMHAQFTTLQL